MSYRPFGQGFSPSPPVLVCILQTAEDMNIIEGPQSEVNENVEI